jgi:hypothetical protein
MEVGKTAMGLDIWFREDLRNAILAANEASNATAEAATSQDARTLDLIAEKLREELPEGTSRVLLDALHAAAVGNVDVIRHYRRGYRAALATLALAFGLCPAVIDGGKPLEVPILSPSILRRGSGQTPKEPALSGLKGHRPSAISHPPLAIRQRSDDLMIWMISVTCPGAQQCRFFCCPQSENDIYLLSSGHRTATAN